VNTLTVYATDPAGHETQPQLTVTPATVQLVMDPIVLPSPPGPVTVSGTVPVTNPAQSVSVNGVAAPVTVQGGVGHWTAVVPFPEDEAMIFAATATTSAGATAQAAKDTVQPPRAYVGKYTLSQHFWTDDPVMAWKDVTLSLNWDGDPDDVATSSGIAIEQDTSAQNRVSRKEIRWRKGQIQGDLKTYQDGVLQSENPNSQPRPNSGIPDYWEVASEQCEVGTAGLLWNGHSYGWTRTVTSALKVFTGSRPQAREKWFLTLLTTGATYDPYYSAVQPPMGNPAWHPVDRVLDHTEITVAGVYPYCDNCVFVFWPKNRHVDATPKVKDNFWYGVNITPTWPPLYAMRRAYHPDFGKGSTLQQRYDDASLQFGKDSDGEHCPPSGSGDDVPYYADFYIINDKNPTMFPPALRDGMFNVIVRDADANQVLFSDVAHIKQVSSLPAVPPSVTLGAAYRYTYTDPKIVLAGAGNNIAAVAGHEWGHTRGLDEEYDLARKEAAIMYLNPQGFSKRYEINMFEACVLEADESNRPPEP